MRLIFRQHFGPCQTRPKCYRARYRAPGQFSPCAKFGGGSPVACATGPVQIALFFNSSLSGPGFFECNIAKITLVPKLLFGNAVLEAPASRTTRQPRDRAFSYPAMSRSPETCEKKARTDRDGQTPQPGPTANSLKTSGCRSAIATSVRAAPVDWPSPGSHCCKIGGAKRELRLPGSQAGASLPLS